MKISRILYRASTTITKPIAFHRWPSSTCPFILQYSLLYCEASGGPAGMSPLRSDPDKPTDDIAHSGSGARFQARLFDAQHLDEHD